MARNEEKQLARLNRVYLQNQREEDLKKRPPRPRLETLTTPGELRKWLPTITRDIEFYVKQMEVPCYREQQIEEFNRRISHLRGEYKAFRRKLRELDPDEIATPWANRPYTVKKCKESPGAVTGSSDKECAVKDSGVASIDAKSAQSAAKFVPLHTPVLDNDEQAILNFGYEKPSVANCPDLNDDRMNQPLLFGPIVHSTLPKGSNAYPNVIDKNITQHEIINTLNGTESCDIPPKVAHSNKDSVVSCDYKGSLNLPYTDSSSSGDET